jgi:hypothetical protein
VANNDFFHRLLKPPAALINTKLLGNLFDPLRLLLIIWLRPRPFFAWLLLLPHGAIQPT